MKDPIKDSAVNGLPNGRRIWLDAVCGVSFSAATVR